MHLSDLPALGHPLSGGLFAGLTTRADSTHCAIVLLPEKPETRLHWQAAMAWAQGLEAELPTRPVAAQLFATLRGEFEQAWHWTSEEVEFDGSYAWNQYFGYGLQSDGRKSYEGRARAVRLIPLQP